jgi:hypothetical protein
MIIDAVTDGKMFVVHDHCYNIHIIRDDGEVTLIDNNLIMKPHLNLKEKFSELSESYPSLRLAPEGIYLLLPECLCLIRYPQ